MSTDDEVNATVVEADRRIARLHEVATELQTVESRDAVYSLAIAAAVEILGFEWCCIALPIDGYFELTHVSPDSPIEEGDRYLRVDEGITGKTYQRGETIHVDRQNEDPDSSPAKDSFQSLLSIPIDDSGVFQGYSSERNAFDSTDREIAELLVAHVSAAIDRIERERELKAQNDRLDRFASVVSHDMRGPLQLATTHIELARDTDNQEHYESALDAIDRADRIIDDVLAVARGNQDVDPEDCNLAYLSRLAWDSVSDDDTTFEPPETTHILADPDTLLRLLENLLRNAVEHGGDEIAVTVTDDGFAVADNGPGFPDGADDLFEIGTSHGGQTGLGLAICSEVAEAHDWTPSVDTDGDWTRIHVEGVTFN